jgi:molybdate transport system permease protein
MTSLEIQAILLSMKVALFSTVLVLPVAVSAALFLSRAKRSVRLPLDILITLPLVLPPVVPGYMLLMLLSKKGFIGGPLYNITGFEIIFTWGAVAIATAIISLPLMVRTMEVAFQGVDRRLESASRSLGASKWRTFLYITVPLSYKGIIAGALVGFTRGLAEFGATIVVAGNIPGKTQTISLALFSAIETGQDGVAARLILVSVSLAVVVLVAYSLLVNQQRT